MPEYDLTPGQLIECKWVDPSASSDWKDAKAATTFYRFVCRSVGYVHATGPDGLVLTACYGDDDSGERSLLLRQCLPWNCITDLWVLEVSEKDQ